MQRVQGRVVVMTQRWTDIVWAHWRVDPAAVDALLPAGVRADVYDGAAWVGFVPFEMRDLRLAPAGRRLPRLGSTASFSEVNVRTYVTGPEGPGVWFHSLDAASRAAVLVARAAWSLPYVDAQIRAELTPTSRSWRVRRRHGATGAIGVALGGRVVTGTLEAFLTARFRLYAPLGHHALLTAPVRHRPWELRQATVQELDIGLVEAAGYHLLGPPDHVVAGSGVEVAIGRPGLLRA